MTGGGAGSDPGAVLIRGLPLDQAYAQSAAVMTENLMAEDAVEGIGAFLGKRAPVWRHR